MRHQVIPVILLTSSLGMGSCSDGTSLATASPDAFPLDAGMDESAGGKVDGATGAAEVPLLDAALDSRLEDARDSASSDQASNRTYQVQRLTSGTSESGFGYALAISGDTLAIASPSEGLVHFFDRTARGWIEVQTVSLPQLAAYHVGVESLALDGDVTVAGSPDISRPGWVHVLRRVSGQWTIEARLDDPAADKEGMFGHAVGVSGDTIVVGAKGNAPNNPGAAYAFVKSASGWSQQATFESLSPDAPAGSNMRDQFGWSVAISGDRAAVVRVAGPQRGAAVYRRSNGTWEKDLGFPPRIVSYGQPISVSLSPERLLLGDNADNLAYLYRFDGVGGWTQEHRLTAEPRYNLGYSVALTSKVAVLGGLSRNDSGREGRGNVYAFVFDQDAWTGPIELVPPDDGTSLAGFGQRVSASGSTVLVGASRASEFSKEYGAVYVFDFGI